MISFMMIDILSVFHQPLKNKHTNANKSTRDWNKQINSSPFKASSERQQRRQNQKPDFLKYYANSRQLNESEMKVTFCGAHLSATEPFVTTVKKEWLREEQPQGTEDGQDNEERLDLLLN